MGHERSQKHLKPQYPMPRCLSIVSVQRVGGPQKGSLSSGVHVAGVFNTRRGSSWQVWAEQRSLDPPRRTNTSPRLTVCLTSNVRERFIGTEKQWEVSAVFKAPSISPNRSSLKVLLCHTSISVEKTIEKPGKNTHLIGVITSMKHTTINGYKAMGRRTELP